jgi:two-component system chemotaxis response regulator CheY
MADDSVMIRKMLMKSLANTRLADFTFVEANDGQEALEKYNPDEIDMVFLDLSMPRMGGVEFLQAVKAKGLKRVPAVFITAETNMEKLMTAVRESDVDGFLSKPVHADRLAKGLKNLIDSIPIRQPQASECTVPHGECLGQAMSGVLNEMCGLELTPEPEDPELRQSEVVVGSISIDGDVKWAVVLGYQPDMACELATMLAGEAVDLNHPDLGDAIGELTNIIAGRTQALLQKEGVTVDISLPVVSHVKQLRVLVQRKNSCDNLHYACSAGRCWAGVTVGIGSGLVL